MKKILSIILLVCFVPFSASAFSEVLEDDFRNIDIIWDSTDPIIMNVSSDQSSVLIAAKFLASEGIIVDRGDNIDLYDLDNEIQRQAVMKIVMKLSWKTIPEGCRGEFSDVDVNDWPCKYIEAALDAWYIAANDTFRPYDSITLTEAMKLVLKAKGIEKTQVTSNWQEDYMVTAYEYGIIDEEYYNYNADATRGWIFQIATATIEKEEEIKVKQEEKLMSDEAL